MSLYQPHPCVRTTEPNGLLLYTDDGGYFDFLELKLVSGSVRLRYNFGRRSGAKVLNSAIGELNDGRVWHRVEVVRFADGTTVLDVDGNR